MDQNEVIVSVCCITYNHAPYIRQCLDGFMMQQTNFAFEVLIHDDASTDGTAEIIKEYEVKYPDIIKPIYEKENQWVKGRRGSAVFNFPRAKGKYIALCEGDDYWTDPLKLQKQVDFLESNPEFVLSTHYYYTYRQEQNSFYDIAPSSITGSQVYDLCDYISYKHWYTQPLTSLFRSSALSVFKNKQFKYTKDVSLFYMLLTRGKGYLHNEVMGVYRVHNQGVWSGVNRQKRIADDLKVLWTIYEVEKTDSSATYIYNFLMQTGYLGVSFFLKNTYLYFSVLRILYKYYGVEALSVFFHSINYRKRKN